jgi:predicted HTH transcriptional regulator
MLALQRCLRKDMSIEIRTEAALQALIGESESIELEFKGPDDFLSWPQSKQNITKDLSKEVSAFANTYGGQIVIGIRETRDSPRGRAVEIASGIED